ncbi:MAG: hypothetical protein ACREON_05470 [Gemmatimonadaceae bacterium]
MPARPDAGDRGGEGGRTGVRPAKGSVLVDGHVHFHQGFDRLRFFDSAWHNFVAGAVRRALTAPLAGMLCFTESSGAHAFDALRRLGGQTVAGAWTASPTGEEESVLVMHADGQTVPVLAGRQIVTREGLEVLALAWRGEYADRAPIDVTLVDLARAGAVPVIPWGFGKWWFRRGALVGSLLHRQDLPRFFLGDNGGRMAGGPRPRLFAEGEAAGRYVLPGSDPLPFPSQQEKAGRYGFVLTGELDRRRPAAWLREHLASLRAQPTVFGQLERPAEFARAQIRMQLRNRVERSRP